MLSKTISSQMMKIINWTAPQSYLKKIHNPKHLHSSDQMDNHCQTSPHNSNLRGSNKTKTMAQICSLRRSEPELMPISRLSFAQLERLYQSLLDISLLECHKKSCKENSKLESMIMKKFLSLSENQRTSPREERCFKTSLRPWKHPLNSCKEIQISLLLPLSMMEN